jgi:peptide/nickel transport system substrate-binding protein
VPTAAASHCRLSFDAGRPEYTGLAQALQRYWQAIGIKVVLEGAERPGRAEEGLHRLRLRRHAAELHDLGRSGARHRTALRHDLDQAGLDLQQREPLFQPEVDALFSHGQNGLTREERAKDYFQVQEILARDLPVLVLHQQAEIDAATVKLKDVFLTANYVWWGSVWMSE